MRKEENFPIELVRGGQPLVSVARGSHPWCFYASLEPGGRSGSAQGVRLVELASMEGRVRRGFSKCLLQGPCGKSCREGWGDLGVQETFPLPSF